MSFDSQPSKNPMSKVEVNQENLSPESFSQLSSYVSTLSPNRKPSSEVVLQEVYSLVDEVMPYDRKGADDFDEHVTEYAGVDGISHTQKVSLTNYFKLHHNDNSKSVCRHQALLAAILIEKLIERKLLPEGTKVMRGSNVAYKNSTKRNGHAWAHVMLPSSDKRKLHPYIVDIAQHVLGELVTNKHGSFVNGVECNEGGLHDTWSKTKLWPYQGFNDIVVSNHLHGNYTLAVQQKNPQFVQREDRHLIGRDTPIDKGYKWDGTGDVAIVVDWEKYYSHGYQELEKRLTTSLFKKIHEKKNESPFLRKKEEKEFHNIIASTHSFQELYLAITEIGPIQGSLILYKPDDLIEIINGVRYGVNKITTVTSTYGLRNKVRELLGL